MINLKEVLPKDLRKKNGVYSIFNRITKKYYFGSTSAKDGFYGRFSDHLTDLRNNTHANQYLQNSWNKYDEKVFEFKIRIICKPELCLILEQKYLNSCLKANVDNSDFNILGYNILRKAGSTLGYKHTKESKTKIIEG